MFKQFQIVYKNGFEEKQKKIFIKLIHKNILLGIRTLIEGIKTLGIEYSLPKSEKMANKISEIDIENMDFIEENIAKDVDYLWRDEGIKKAFKRK